MTLLTEILKDKKECPKTIEEFLTTMSMMLSQIRTFWYSFYSLQNPYVRAPN